MDNPETLVILDTQNTGQIMHNHQTSFSGGFVYSYTTLFHEHEIQIRYFLNQYSVTLEVIKIT
jgi:hypothetical protein